MTIERRQRKSPVLSGASLPCLGEMPTINITGGCGMDCVYCYTQSYPSHPGPGRVVLYDNIPDLVRRELAQRRSIPERVYFSTASDVFALSREIQDVTFETMKALLEHGVSVSFLTKGYAHPRFDTLFAAHPGRVFARIGITTLDREIWRALEPTTTSPQRRLAFGVRLRAVQVDVAARLDPLVPDLTDTPENLMPLLAAMVERGIVRAAASYLFVRPAFADRVGRTLALPQLLGSPAPERWPWHRFSKGVGGGRMIDDAEREERFGRLRELATSHGIELTACACKNSDVDGHGYCGIAGPKQTTTVLQTPTLFGS